MRMVNNEKYAFTWANVKPLLRDLKLITNEDFHSANIWSLLLFIPVSYHIFQTNVSFAATV